MLDTAVIDLGLLPHFFWDMSLVDYYRYFIHKQKEKAMEWDKTRVLMSYVLNTQVEKKQQKKPKDIIPLWIDKLEQVKKVRKLTSEQDKREIAEKLKRNG